MRQLESSQCRIMSFGHGACLDLREATSQIDRRDIPDLIDISSNRLHGWPKISRSTLKLKLLLLLGCAVALILLLQPFATCRSAPATTRPLLIPLHENVRAAVETAKPTQSSSPSSSAILEVFQVYQPVLTPAGLIDETTASDGTSNTATIGSAESMSGCTQLLMEYSFGFSYGHPFVGTFPYFTLLKTF
jgi:hypothetical protein